MDKVNLIQSLQRIVELQSLSNKRALNLENKYKEYEEFHVSIIEALVGTEKGNSQSRQILEVNNYIKSSLNESFTTIKELMQTLHSWHGEIVEKINSITENENAFENSVREHAQSFVNQKISYKNKVEYKHQINNEDIRSIEKEIAEIVSKKSNYKANNDSLKISTETLKEESNNKSEQIDKLQMNSELIQMQLDLNEKEDLEAIIKLKNDILTNTTTVDELQDEIKTHTLCVADLNNKLQANLDEHNKYLISITEGENKQQQVTKETENIRQHAVNYDELARKSQSEFAINIEEIESSIKEVIKELQPITNQRKIYQDEICSIKNEIQFLELKIELNHEEIQKLENTLKNQKTEYEVTECEIQRVDEDLKNAELKYLELEENATVVMQEYDHQLSVLQQLNNIEQEEIIGIDNKIESLQVEFCLKSKTELEDIQKIDTSNKAMQQEVEKLEAQLKDITMKKEELQLLNSKNKNAMKQLDIHCELASQKVKRIEAAKQQRKNIIPKPQLKRPVSNRVTNQSLKMRTQDDDSESSSVEGLKLSYAEFRKKKLRM